MPFHPQVNDQLRIDDTTYHIAEHPAAPGVPYGQEGRQAMVYQLVAEGGDTRALKVFKPRFRLPALVGLARRMVPFAEMPGHQHGIGQVGVLAQQNRVPTRLQHSAPADLQPWHLGERNHSPG